MSNLELKKRLYRVAKMYRRNPDYYKGRLGYSTKNYWARVFNIPLNMVDSWWNELLELSSLDFPEFAVKIDDVNAKYKNKYETSTELNEEERDLIIFLYTCMDGFKWRTLDLDRISRCRHVYATPYLFYKWLNDNQEMKRYLERLVEKGYMKTRNVKGKTVYSPTDMFYDTINELLGV